MKSHAKKLGVLWIAGALAVPAAGAAQTAVRLEVRAASDTVKAQQLAEVAPKRAYAYLRRSRAELAGAYRKSTAAAPRSVDRAVAMTQRLRADAKSMRSLAQKSSGALALGAAKAVQVDIRMEAGLADQTPADQQAVAADAAADMTNTAVLGLRSTSARAIPVRRAFASAVAEGLQLMRGLAARAGSSSQSGQAPNDDLPARIAAWASSLRNRLQGTAEGNTSVPSTIGGSVTLTVLADTVAGEAAVSSSTDSAAVQGQVAPGWTASVLP